MRGLSLVAASGDHSPLWCAGLSLLRPLLLRSTGSRRAGSVIVAHGPSCSAACGIFPDQGLNPCPLHWQADSQPLRHQGSPAHRFLFVGHLKKQDAFVGNGLYVLLWEVILINHLVNFLSLRRIVFQPFQRYSYPTFCEKSLLVYYVSPQMLSLVCAFGHRKCLRQFEGNRVVRTLPVTSSHRGVCLRATLCRCNEQQTQDNDLVKYLLLFLWGRVSAITGRWGPAGSRHLPVSNTERRGLYFGTL